MVKDFIQYLKLEKRYASHTLKAYEKDIDEFRTFLADDDIDWGNVDFKDVRAWMVHLAENDYTGKSINRKLSSVRTFYKYLKRRGEVNSNPAQLVQGPKIRKRLPVYIPEQEINTNTTVELFDCSYENQITELMVELLYQTGIRLSELISLKESDISSQSIKVLGKRNKERIIPISSILYRKITDYLSLRNHEVGEKEKANGELFLTKKGKSLYPKFVYRKVFAFVSSFSKIDKKSPHVLRHTFATHMLNNGASLETIKEILGHTNLVATQVYTHNSLSKLKQIYKQAHPRG